MRRFVAIALILLAFAPAARAQSKEELIYPRGSAPAGVPAAAESRGPGSGLILATALLAAAGGWWLWQKRRGSFRLGSAQAARLAIVESRSLGSRQYLVVADYDGRKFLLGVCPGSIELLTPLDGGSPPPR
jgi:flagellar protein FliO/FliZ